MYVRSLADSRGGGGAHRAPTPKIAKAKFNMIYRSRYGVFNLKMSDVFARSASKRRYLNSKVPHRRRFTKYRHLIVFYTSLFGHLSISGRLMLFSRLYALMREEIGRSH